MKLQLVVRRAPVQAGLKWLQQGWQIFKQQPGLWIQVVFTIHFLSLLGALHPLLGIIVALLNPFLTAGLYSCIVARQRGVTVSFEMLFQPLKEPAFRAIFIRLAAANMLCSIPLTLLGTELFHQAQAGAIDWWLTFAFAMGLCVVLMMFAYAVAIAYFLREQRLLPILQASLMACWRNVQPLTLYALLAIALLSTGIPTMMITWLLVLPLLSISFFLSFSEFFALSPVTGAQEESNYFEV
jgi:uncharacterized membrane protein